MENHGGMTVTGETEELEELPYFYEFYNFDKKQKSDGIWILKGSV
jgi:hypothetical protein